MVDIASVRHDVNLGLLFIVLFCISIFVASSFFYIHKVESINVRAEMELAKLASIEQQLILKEQELELLRAAEQDILSDKLKIHSNLLNLESEYQTLRIEKVPILVSPKPFSKAICKTTGNAGC